MLTSILTQHAPSIAALLSEYSPNTVLPTGKTAIELTDDKYGNITARIYGENNAVIDLTFYEPPS